MVRSRRPDRKGAPPRAAGRKRKKEPELFSSRAQAQAAGPARGKPGARKKPLETRPTRAKPGQGMPAARRPAPASEPAAAPSPATAPGPRAGPRAASPRTSKGLWLYGRHAVEAALRNPQRSCHRLLAVPEALERLGPLAGRPGLEVTAVERDELDRRFAPDAVHQGVALSAAPLPRLDLERACAPEPGPNLVLVLDQITDPHNLGAILRSAAAFDARAVIVPERRSAELGGAAAKAASGALDLVPVVEVTNLARALEALAGLGYWRLGLDAEAPQTVEQAPETPNLALVLGAEGAGLRRLVAEHCDLSVRLPIAPAMESLNVSVAAGIALYALARRDLARGA